MELLDDNYRSNRFNRSIEDLIENGYETDAYRYIREGFEIFKKNPGLFILFTIIVFGISWALSELRFGPLINIFIGPCLAAGWYLAAQRLSHNQDLEIRHFFDGFKYWQKLVPYQVVATIFILFGMILLLFPGIYLGVSYLFIIPIILFYRDDLSLMDTLEGSRKVITKKWWNFLGFIGLLFLVNLAGVLALGVGLFVSIPTSACAMYMFYEDVFGVDTANLEI